MESIVKINYGKKGQYPEVYIDGEIISKTSLLSAIIYNDIFAWAEKFFGCVDDEIYAPYKVVVTGHPYHFIALNSVKDKSEFCQNIEFVENKHEIPVAEKFRFAKEQAEKYGVQDAMLETRLAFNSETPDEFISLGVDSAAIVSEKTNYVLLRAGETASQPYKYRIYLGDKNCVSKKGANYDLFVTEKTFPVLLDYLNVYHVMLPYVDKFFDEIRLKDLDECARLQLEAYLEEEYRVFIGGLPDTMECGNEYVLDYQVFPSSFAPLNLSVKSDNVNVAECRANVIIPKESGTFTASLVGCGTVYFKQNVNVVKHNFVTTITLVVPTLLLNIDDTLDFRCIVSPQDAEDADDVKFTVSDESIAVISGRNQVYALAPGRVKVTARTSHAEKSFYLDVLPRVADLVLSDSQITLPYGAEAFVECAIVPYNASPKPVVTWKTSDTSIAEVVTTSEYGCKITSKGFGTCTVTCCVKDTKIEKSIEIKTPKHGCYIATSVYGSYDCPEVWVLRRYRDEKLAKSAFGRAFIKTYYFCSPKVVSMFGKQKWFNRFWKKALDKKVNKLKSKGYDETPYKGN